MRSPILVLAIVMAAVGGTFPGRAGELDRTTNGQDVTVSVVSPFTQVPPGGCVPYQVNIRNDRNAPGTWQLYFQGAANISSLGATVFAQDLTVAANSSGSFAIVVPVPIAAEKGSTSLNVGVGGPGFDNASVYKRFFGYVYSNNAGPRSPFAILGKDVLGPIGTGPLEAFYKDHDETFYGSQVDTANLPSDWRAYSGVGALILKDTEWLSLDSAQRGAISDYVSQGGHLTLFTSDSLESRQPELQLPGSEGKPGDYGFGVISLVFVPSFPPDAKSLDGVIQNNPANSAQNVDQDFSTWGLRDLAGTIAVSAVFILSFVILFGGLIGPVNLFVFARGANRFRLFWTTPLISILASLALIAGILVTDGLGGRGKQMIAIYSLPESNREAVIQEEVARTAVLFSNRWRTDQDYLITPISEHVLDNARAPYGSRVYPGRTDLEDSPDTYRQDGNEFSGNWFRSRSVSGQYLQAVRPSRFVLTVLNPQALNSRRVPPVVLSSFPQELTRVFLIDSQRNYWTCENLEPGRKMTCSLSTGDDFDQFWVNACNNAGGKLRPLLRQVRDRPGCFYATGAISPGDKLATLGEIQWQVVTGIYLGPWVASPIPESGP